MSSQVTRPTYSRQFGLIFLFNLILGTGALALPRAFKEAGWLVTGILLAFVAFMSYVPATFIIESMAICNATKLDHESMTGEGEATEDEELLPGPYVIRAEDFEISTKYELGELFRHLVGRAWTLFFYVTISLYIYGDLSIYAAAVSKSLRDVTCNVSVDTLNETDPCWLPGGISRTTVYKIYLTIFACVLGPPFFCNVTKIRWLQAATIIARWVSVLLMSSIAIARIVEFPEVPRLGRHQMPAYMSLLGSPDRPHPPIANFPNLPKAFGVCVYSFMCHHSLPGVITPIDEKNRLFSSIMLPVYLLIYFCYLLLSGTAITAFDYIHDLYTLNFVPSNDPILRPGWFLLLLEYFLALYPAFALSSNFPILGTTLANNLTAIFSAVLPPGRNVDLIIRWCGPLLALIPPILIALVVNDVGQLVSVTGAFGGIFLMYVFPVVLVFHARRALEAKFKSETLNEESVTVDQGRHCVVNRYRSPFWRSIWLVVVGLWAALCLIVLIFNKFGVF